jgi:cytochrome b
MSTTTIRVWDWPTRLFHWLLVICVVTLFVTGKLGGNWMEWHKKAGYCALGLILFRVFWGFAGSETSRFTKFVRGPRAVIDYLKGRWQAAPGHNPLGAWSVLAILGVILFQAVTGLFANDDILLEGPLYVLVSKDTSDFLTKLHHWSSNAAIALVVLHVAAIVWYARFKKESLVGPMIKGTKTVEGQAEPKFVRGAWVWMAVAAGIVWAVVNRVWM